jgi:hypothetical protein
MQNQGLTEGRSGQGRRDPDRMLMILIPLRRQLYPIEWLNCP